MSVQDRGGVDEFARVMVIPSLFTHAENGVWALTEERLQELQAQRVEARLKTYSLIEEPILPEQLYEKVNGFAVVRIAGTLGKGLNWIDRLFGGVDYDEIVAALDAAEADPECGAIVLDVRSPGGMVIGLQECADRIAGLQKDSFCYTDLACCSAAYWLGSQCDRVYSSASAVLGSIGVLAVYVDQSKALAEQGIKVNAFSAGKWKLAGAPFKPMTDEERAMFQGRIDKAYGAFTAAVNGKRTVEAGVMQGQVFDGEDAVKAGLSDGIFPSLQKMIAELAG